MAIDDETQAMIDVFKRSDGVMDWYKVLDLNKNASQEQIEGSYYILSTAYGPSTGIERKKEDTVRYVLLQQAIQELGNVERRKKI